MLLEEVDRGIFREIEKVLIQELYLPDRGLYTTVAEFEAAVAQLKQNTGTFIIDIKGVSTKELKEEAKVATISVVRRSIDMGSIGAAYTDYYKDKDADTFEHYFNPDNTEDIEYEIRLFGNNSEQLRIMQRLVSKALGKRRYIPAVSSDRAETGENFLLLFENVVDLGIIVAAEVVMRYNAIDCIIEPARKLPDVAKIKQVNPPEGDTITNITVVTEFTKDI